VDSVDSAGVELVSFDPRMKVVRATKAQTKWWRRFFFTEGAERDLSERDSRKVNGS